MSILIYHRQSDTRKRTCTVYIIISNSNIINNVPFSCTPNNQCNSEFMFGCLNVHLSSFLRLSTSLIFLSDWHVSVNNLSITGLPVSKITNAMLNPSSCSHLYLLLILSLRLLASGRKKHKIIRL